MKAKSTIGKIYVNTNAYLGVLKHFVEAFNYMFHRFDKLTKSSTIESVCPGTPETVLKPMN